MIMFLVFASITPLIINRIGKLNPIIIGAITSLVGSLGLLMFHSTELAVSTNLAIIGSGLSMTITATWNIVVSSSPKSFIGISVGVGALMLFIGMAIGPALTGVYLESRESIAGIPGRIQLRDRIISVPYVRITVGCFTHICADAQAKGNE